VLSRRYCPSGTQGNVEACDLRVESGDGSVGALGGPVEFRCQLGVVQQAMGFPRVLTVGELVRGSAVRAGPGVPAGPVLVEVGIIELRARRAVRLLGGQQQSVALAMALVGDPGRAAARRADGWLGDGADLL
jgi:ABC-type cobalamin/Fe3+-siderophores transport system ATPase subunit